MTLVRVIGSSDLVGTSFFFRYCVNILRNISCPIYSILFLFPRVRKTRIIPFLFYATPPRIEARRIKRISGIIGHGQYIDSIHTEWYLVCTVLSIDYVDYLHFFWRYISVPTQKARMCMNWCETQSHLKLPPWSEKFVQDLQPRSSAVGSDSMYGILLYSMYGARPIHSTLLNVWGRAPRTLYGILP